MLGRLLKIRHGTRFRGPIRWLSRRLEFDMTRTGRNETTGALIRGQPEFLCKEGEDRVAVGSGEEAVAKIVVH